MVEHLAVHAPVHPGNGCELGKDIAGAPLFPCFDHGLVHDLGQTGDGQARDADIKLIPSVLIQEFGEVTNAAMDERGPGGGSFGNFKKLRVQFDGKEFAFGMLEFECGSRHRPHARAQFKDALWCGWIDLTTHFSRQTSAGWCQRGDPGSMAKEGAKPTCMI